MQSETNVMELLSSLQMVVENQKLLFFYLLSRQLLIDVFYSVGLLKNKLTGPLHVMQKNLVLYCELN